MKTNRPQGGYRVICQDGQCRHGADLFATVAEALEWADWGHFCLSGHRLELVDPQGFRRPSHVAGRFTS